MAHTSSGFTLVMQVPTQEKTCLRKWHHWHHPFWTGPHEKQCFNSGLASHSTSCRDFRETTSSTTWSGLPPLDARLFRRCSKPRCSIAEMAAFAWGLDAAGCFSLLSMALYLWKRSVKVTSCFSDWDSVPKRIWCPVGKCFTSAKGSLSDWRTLFFVSCAPPSASFCRAASAKPSSHNRTMWRQSPLCLATLRIESSMPARPSAFSASCPSSPAAANCALTMDRSCSAE